MWQILENPTNTQNLELHPCKHNLTSYCSTLTFPLIKTAEFLDHSWQFCVLHASEGHRTDCGRAV